MKARTKLAAGLIGLVLLTAACASARAGQDRTIILAEQTWLNGQRAVNAFLKVEREARKAADPGILAFMREPKVLQFAETLKAAKNPKTGEPLDLPFGQWIFRELDEAIQAYKTGRSAENEASVASFLATATELLETATQLMGGDERVSERYRKALEDEGPNVPLWFPAMPFALLATGTGRRKMVAQTSRGKGGSSGTAVVREGSGTKKAIDPFSVIAGLTQLWRIYELVKNEIQGVIETAQQSGQLTQEQRDEAIAYFAGEATKPHWLPAAEDV